MICRSYFVCLWIWLSCGVFGANTEVKLISVTEGDSVTLHTELNEFQSSDQILWFYTLNSSQTRIAGIYRENIDMFDSNVTFGDRLKIDSQTGSLTIRNIRFEHSGHYKLQIMTKKDTIFKSFTIAVHAPLPLPLITSKLSNCSLAERSSVSRCPLVCSVFNVSAVSLSWYKGNSLLSNISVSNLSISLSLPLVIECLDDSYSCVVNNTIRNQTTHLDINQTCHKSTKQQQSHWVTVGVIVGLLLVLVAGLIYMYLRRSKSTQVRQEGN